MFGEKTLLNSARLLDEVDKRWEHECPECEEGIYRKVDEYPSQHDPRYSREVYECSECGYKRRPHKGPGMFEMGLYKIFH